VNPDVCCRLGAEFRSGLNLLAETENFFVVPTIGSMGIEGYVLICSKRHHMGIGDIPGGQHQELEDLLRRTRAALRSVYGVDPVVFEHGPRTARLKGGVTLDHAHLHVVPAPVTIVKPLVSHLRRERGAEDGIGVRRVEGFGRLREIYQARRASYLLAEDAEEGRHVIEVKFPVPSQFIRHFLAHRMGLTEWDWREHPQPETFARTLDALRGRILAR
jgi:diadenosine tetraphosphate (Ap4A) HIT family hydrolase